MASRPALFAAFATFDAAGLVPPPAMRGDEAAVDFVVTTWERLLGDVADGALAAAVDAWCCRIGVRFWPSAGEIRALLPRREAPQLEAQDRDDDTDRSPYGLAADWARQLALDAYAEDPSQDFEACINARAAEVYPLHDPAFAALDEDGRWRHFCARRDARAKAVAS